MEDVKINHEQVIGWGIDADPENEPTYPMKKYTGDDHQRSNYQRPPMQPPTVEVLHSIERPGISAVYGATLPPKGWSGAIRRKAFQYSENHYGHWLLLLLADRVNVAEGLVNDLKRGIVPNVLSEKGFKAQWKYDRKRTLTRLAVTAAVIATIIIVRKNRNNSDDD